MKYLLIEVSYGSNFDDDVYCDTTYIGVFPNIKSALTAAKAKLKEDAEYYADGDKEIIQDFLRWREIPKVDAKAITTTDFTCILSNSYGDGFEDDIEFKVIKLAE